MTSPPALGVEQDALEPQREYPEFHALFESAPGDVKLMLSIDLLAMHLSDDDEEVRPFTPNLNVEFVTSK